VPIFDLSFSLSNFNTIIQNFQRPKFKRAFSYQPWDDRTWLEEIVLRFTPMTASPDDVNIRCDCANVRFREVSKKCVKTVVFANDRNV